MANKKNKKKKRKKKKNKIKNDYSSLLKKIEENGLVPKDIIWNESENTNKPKMSEVLVDFAEPLLEAADDNLSAEVAITISALVWNLTFMPENKREDEILKMIPIVSPTDDINDLIMTKSIINMLIVRKEEFFADNKKYILDYEISFAGNKGLNLSVASTLIVNK